MTRLILRPNVVIIRHLFERKIDVVDSQHKFEVYRGKYGELRSKLKFNGDFVAIPNNGLPKDLKPQDVKFFTRNVQVALEAFLREDNLIPKSKPSSNRASKKKIDDKKLSKSSPTSRPD